MTLISMKYLLLLVAIAAAALFIATATPAQARGGGSFASPSAKFMQKNGMQMHANTRQRLNTCATPSSPSWINPFNNAFDFNGSFNCTRRNNSGAKCGIPVNDNFSP